MFENFVPLGNKIFVKIIQQEERTVSGIYLPGDMEMPYVKGSVLAIGRGKQAQDYLGVIPMETEVGDTVIFGKYAGTTIDHEHVVISEDDLLGIL